MAARSKVKVVVRVRPQLFDDDDTWVEVVSPSCLRTLNHRNTQESLEYEFERVFDSTESQLTVYNGCARDLVQHPMNGRNASIFAYGPTGAGKTHTILGTAQDPGLISRCVKDLFCLIDTEHKREEAEWRYDVKYSYLGIYQEKVQDLLDTTKTDLPIREDKTKSIFVTGLTEQRIASVYEFNQTFANASKNRTTAATRENERSSRSHAILMLKVTKRQQQAEPGVTLCGKLMIIDLAGSENNRRTGNQGIRLRESGSINTSLMVLSQVVDALNKGQPCIPYRRSKLTRLLQDSLGGNAHSCMIVNLSPEERYYFDTYTTLLFARKTKKVVNTVRVNELKAKPTLKRSATQAAENAAADAKDDLTDDVTPEKKPCPDSHFLSPFLRHQTQAQAKLKSEFDSKLEELEARLMKQMSSSTGAAAAVSETVTSSALPDSTTPSPRKQSTCIDTSATVAKKLDDLRREIDAFKSSSSSLSSRNKKLTGKKRKSCTVPKSLPDIAEDIHSSCSQASADNTPPPVASTCRPHLADLLNTPLTPLLRKHRRRSRFQSCAAEGKFSQDAHTLNPAQENHNAHILTVLNTGSVKALQDLQTVGAKRAKLIHAYRELHGKFASFEELSSVPGLTYKYLQSFLKGNLVQT